jgi:hypothetical protein
MLRHRELSRIELCQTDSGWEAAGGGPKSSEPSISVNPKEVKSISEVNHSAQYQR